MRPQTSECCIGPLGETYNLAGFEFHFMHLARLQNLESALIEKKCVVPKHFGQLRNRRMIIGKNLSALFAQRLFYLCRVQFHGCSCF
jgi:hypothetical protein